MAEEPSLDLLLVDDEDSPLPTKDPAGKPLPVFVNNFLIRAAANAARWVLEPPKLAVPLLSAHAKAAGLNVKSVYRPLLPWKRAWFRHLLRREPRVVGITTIAMLETYPVARIAAEVRAVSPKSLIVLGGHGAACNPAIRALGDLYISAHGEEALPGLVTALKGGLKLDRVPGVSVSPEGGRTMAGSLRYEGVPRVFYPDWDATSSGCRRYPIEASRGCRFNCSFCCYPGRTGQAYRTVEEVAGEMRYVRERYGIRKFYFVDSSLTAEPEFILGLCAALRKEKFRADWKCFARPDAFDRTPELAGAMAAAGCSWVFMGIESIHDHILAGMRRGMRRDGIERGLERAFGAGLKVHGNFVIGFPGETEATVMETAEFIGRWPFDSVYLCTFGMSPEMRDLAAADPERYAHLKGEPIKDWRHDGMDYRTAYELTARATRRINKKRFWPVASYMADALYPLDKKRA